MTDDTCPHCGSPDTAAILYGLVRPHDDLCQRLATGEVIFGGLVLSDRDPIRRCNQCTQDFAFVTWVRRQLVS
ncbi:MAG: hypothetical protein FWE61_02380 [Micrococcales bacterium]|nr:hypothetical protein [Micrococcales bacterium]